MNSRAKPENWPAYFRLRFDPLEAFLPADFFADLAAFFADFRAGLAAFFLFDDEPFLPEKMFSQLSEYCFVAPMRTTLIVG